MEIWNGQNRVASSAIKFAVLPSGRALSLHPTMGSVDGGTLVSVTGSGFKNGTVARFGYIWSPTPCKFVSTSLLLCTTPTAPSSGRTVVSWSINAASLKSVLYFLYSDPISVISILPTLGESTGKISVTVVGSKFASWQKLGCKIGSKSFDGQYISDTTLLCYVEEPPLGMHSLSISMNGDDYIGTVGFEGIQTAHVREAIPRSGFFKGGTRVGIRGVHFNDRLGYDCRFGAISTTATVSSSTMLACTIMMLSTQGSVLNTKVH
jgi:hypothetical protein